MTNLLGNFRHRLRPLFLVCKLLVFASVAATYYEDSTIWRQFRGLMYYNIGSYDIYCLNYDPSNPDNCQTCINYSDSAQLWTWHAKWGQDCRNSASDGTCEEVYSSQTLSNGTQLGLTYCALASSAKLYTQQHVLFGNEISLQWFW